MFEYVITRGSLGGLCDMQKASFGEACKSIYGGVLVSDYQIGVRIAVLRVVELLVALTLARQADFGS